MVAKILVVEGPSRVGKTTYMHQKFPNAYYANDSGMLGDDYKGQEVVICDGTGSRDIMSLVFFVTNPNYKGPITRLILITNANISHWFEYSDMPYVKLRFVVFDYNYIKVYDQASLTTKLDQYFSS